MAPHSQRNQQSKSERQVNILSDDFFLKNYIDARFFSKLNDRFLKFSSINSDFQTIDGKTSTRKNQQIIE